MDEIPDLDDPRWFPIGYDAGCDTLALLRLDLDTLGASSFLDVRLPTGGRKPVHWPLPDSPPPRPAIALLFHTAFCGSTLLARALHAPPGAVALKEPRVLLDIAKAGLPDRVRDRPRIERAAAWALALLGRRWSPTGRVLIKPTNQVNRLLGPLLRQAAPAPALLLHSSLEEFLLSCCKKLPEAERRVRWMAQFLLPGSRLGRVLGVPADHPFNFVESCVLTWYLQIEGYAEALAADRDGRLRSLSLAELLADPGEAVRQASAWLGLEAALEDLEGRVEHTFARDAKHPERRFDAAARRHEEEILRRSYGALIERALAWAGANIAPHAKTPADWKPLLPDATGSHRVPRVRPAPGLNPDNAGGTGTGD